MNSRVIAPKSYIFSAIIYLGKVNFTSNDLARILVERFSLQRDYLKAKAFAYNQIQNLVNRGLLNKVRQKGIYQYLYSTTQEFDRAIESTVLIYPESDITLSKIEHTTLQICNDTKITLKRLIDKYAGELEKISGAKEIYEELTKIMPDREKEFRKLSIEQSRKYIRTNEKINTLKSIVDNTINLRQ
jgi:predicted DNA-binding transcriptional regulator